VPRKAQPKRVATAEGFAVRGRNTRGAGSEYQEPDGSWRATYRDHDGKVHRIRSRSKTEAMERRAVKLAELEARRPQHERFTDRTAVAQLLDWWLENVAAHKMRPTSLDRYRFRVSRINEVDRSGLAGVVADGVVAGSGRVGRGVGNGGFEPGADSERGGGVDAGADLVVLAPPTR
jgi:hypothetical protein